MPAPDLKWRALLLHWLMSRGRSRVGGRSATPGYTEELISLYPLMNAPEAMLAEAERQTVRFVLDTMPSFARNIGVARIRELSYRQISRSQPC
jgi:hypothetical protein